MAAILRDPDEMGAKTAVVALVDAITGQATGPEEFRRWSDGLSPEIDRLRTAAFREFVRRRIHDRRFHLSIEGGHVPTPAELAEVTDWMQRQLAEWSGPSAVRAVVAGSARTRKTRNIAENRKTQQSGTRREEGPPGAAPLLR